MSASSLRFPRWPLPVGPDLVYERSVLHDQGSTPGYRRTAMAMKYQKGTVYPRGRKVKMWYGKYTVYRSEEHTSELQSRVELVCRLLLEKKKTNGILTHAAVRYDARPFEACNVP